MDDRVELTWEELVGHAGHELVISYGDNDYDDPGSIILDCTTCMETIFELTNPKDLDHVTEETYPMD